MVPRFFSCLALLWLSLFLVLISCEIEVDAPLFQGL